MNIQPENASGVLEERLNSLSGKAGGKISHIQITSESVYPVLLEASDLNNPKKCMGQEYSLSPSDFVKKCVEFSSRETKQNESNFAIRKKTKEIIDSFAQSVQAMIEEVQHATTMKLLPPPKATDFIQDLLDGCLNNDDEFVKRLEDLSNYMANFEDAGDEDGAVYESRFSVFSEFFESTKSEIMSLLKKFGELETLLATIPPPKALVKVQSDRVWHSKDICNESGISAVPDKPFYLTLSNSGKVVGASSMDHKFLFEAQVLPENEAIRGQVCLNPWRLNFAVCGMKSSTVMLFNSKGAKISELRNPFKEEKAFINKIAWLSPTKLLAISEKGVCTFDFKNLEVSSVHLLKFKEEVVHCYSFSVFSATEYFAGDSHGNLHAVQASTGTIHKTYEKLHSEVVRSLCLARKGSFIASSSSDRTVKLLNKNTGNLEWTHLFSAAVWGMIWAPGESFLICHTVGQAKRSDQANSIFILDKKDGSIILKTQLENPITCFGFVSRFNRHLVVGGKDGEITKIELRN